jgi:HPt (histidine-containing phosphotransfer) domain-containing protein
VSEEGTTPPPAADWDQALAQLGGDEETLREVTQLLLDTCPALVTPIRAAVQAGDAVALIAAAHTLKGSLAVFAAAPAVAAALALEMLGRQADLEPAGVALTHLEAELARLLPQLRAWVAP